ncbi:MAG: PRC-barrel domain-containing protein [Euryarchaeota archaeon]|nr:PRC-barrel domain-containing protein [Euryarchaeota archaeon]
MRISDCFGLEIYNSKGDHVGIVNDVVLDFKKGGIFGFAIGQEKGLEKVAVPYRDVLAVGDIVIVKASEKIE